MRVVVTMKIQKWIPSSMIWENLKKKKCINFFFIKMAGFLKVFFKPNNNCGDAENLKGKQIFRNIIIFLFNVINFLSISPPTSLSI